MQDASGEVGRGEGEAEDEAGGFEGHEAGRLLLRRYGERLASTAQLLLRKGVSLQSNEFLLH